MAAINISGVHLEFPNPRFTMSFQDSTTEVDLTTQYSTKDDHWFKNNKAHTIMRARYDKAGPFCSVCRQRNCFDLEFAHGNKSLKKSKHPEYHKVKFFNNADCNPYFLHIRNGETE